MSILFAPNPISPQVRVDLNGRAGLGWGMDFIRPALVIAVLAITPARADPPVIEGAAVRGAQISVTLSHGDTGWDHYADGWKVIGADDVLLGTRVLHHPHVEEQPFTRSLTLAAPPTGAFVWIIAKDNLGTESVPFKVELAD